MPEDKQFDNSVTDADKKTKEQTSGNEKENEQADNVNEQTDKKVETATKGKADAAAKLKELQEKMKQLESEFQELADSADIADSKNEGDVGISNVKISAERQDDDAEKSDEGKQESDAAQDEAAKRYQTLFGDRRRLVKSKPKKGVVRILAGAAVIVLLIIVALRIPTFFNAATPSKPENINNFAAVYGYEEWKDTTAFYFTLGETDITAVQTNVIVDTDRQLFANIVCYSFDSNDDAKAYMQSVADKNGVAAEYKKFIFAMGSCSYGDEASGYYYESWFSSSILVEVYATYQLPESEDDTTMPYETAKMLRGQINRAS